MFFNSARFIPEPTLNAFKLKFKGKSEPTKTDLCVNKIKLN